MKKVAINGTNLRFRGGVYFADFVDPAGVRVRCSLKTSDKKLAEMRVKKMMVEAYEKGHFDMKKPVKMLFKDLAQKVLDYAKDRKKAYKKIYVPVIKHLVDCFGNKYLHQITLSQVNAYQSERKNSVALVTVNKEVAVLRRCFNLAMQWGMSQNNPVKGIEFFHVPKRKFRFLTVEEISSLIQSCLGDIRDIVLTALHTGGRKSEILGLKWKNIDFENKLVVFEETKNDEIRQIPMTEAIQVMLSNKRSQAKKNEFVFVGKKEGKSIVNINTAFNKKLMSLGIKNCRFHDLRHTFASQLVMAGVDILTVKELLGHKDLKTTLIYAHLAPKHKKEAVRIYEKHLGKILTLSHKSVTSAYDGDGA